jgi:hypothetical protein
LLRHIEPGFISETRGTRDFLECAENENLGIKSRFAQQPRDNPTIATVITGAAKNGNALRPGPKDSQVFESCHAGALH